jgi:hypothetical protein
MITALPSTAALPTANQLATEDPLGSEVGQIPLSFSDLSGRLVEVTGGPSSGRSSRLARVVAQVRGQLYPRSLQGELD